MLEFFLKFKLNTNVAVRGLFIFQGAFYYSIAKC
jgi:hypothetical protein